MQRLRVADDLELDQVGLQQLARQLRGQHGVLGRVAAGGVRQNRVALAIDVVEHRSPLPIVEVDAADRDRHHRGAAGLVRRLHDLHRRILSGADDQARAQLERADAKRVVCSQPPATAVMISMRSPSTRRSVSYSRARNDALVARDRDPVRGEPSSSSSAPTVSSSGSSREFAVDRCLHA